MPARDDQSLPVLAIRRGGLGDTLLMLPVLAALRRRHRGELHFAGVREFVEVAAHFGACGRVLSSEDLQLWRGGERLAAYACVVSDHAIERAPVPVQVFAPQRLVTGLPAGAQWLAQLNLADPGSPVLAPRLPVAAMAPIVLAPGSGGAAKCWPRASWLALAAELTSEAQPLAIVIGETERDRDDPRRWPWPGRVEHLDNLSCVELAERLRHCRAFVGNDSGTTHLAALLSLPTVALFGPSDASVFAPQGPRVTVLQDPARAAPPCHVVADVLAALRRSLVS